MPHLEDELEYELSDTEDDLSDSEDDELSDTEDELSDSEDDELSPPVLTSTEAKEPCPICLSITEKAVATLCGHVFHEQCIQEWSKASNKCPVCRQCMHAEVNHSCANT